MTTKQLKWLAVTAFISTGMGWLFSSLGIFLPWLLGPLVIMMLLRNIGSWPFYWPTWIRNIGLLIIGIQMGTSFTTEALELMLLYLPLMFILTLLVVGFSFATAWGIHKSTSYSFQTALLGSFPGGLSQMVLLSEEVKDAEPSAVALMQTIRILLVITVVPFLVTYFFPSSLTGFAQTEKALLSSLSFIHIISLIIGIVLFLLLMIKARFPIPFMLAPLISVIIFNVMTNNPFVLPDFPVAAAQILLGAHLGLQMKGMKALLSAKPLVIVVMMNLALITFCIGISFVLNSILSFPLIDMFLSAAPGGVAEMAITAYTVGADVSTVTSFHLFRIFFILFVAAPVTVYFLKKRLNQSV